jgi:hypothetical protein
MKTRSRHCCCFFLARLLFGSMSCCPTRRIPTSSGNYAAAVHHTDMCISFVMGLRLWARSAASGAFSSPIPVIPRLGHARGGGFHTALHACMGGVFLLSWLCGVFVLHGAFQSGAWAWTIGSSYITRLR